MITDKDLFGKVQNSRLRTLARIEKTPEAERGEREILLSESLGRLKKPPKRVRVSMPPYAPRTGNPPMLVIGNPLTKKETAELEGDAAEEHRRGMQLIEDGQVEEGSLHMGKSIMAEEVGMRYGNPGAWVVKRGDKYLTMNYTPGTGKRPSTYVWWWGPPAMAYSWKSVAEAEATYLDVLEHQRDMAGDGEVVQMLDYKSNPPMLVLGNPSPEAQDFISAKISKLMHEGYPQQQAIAIAHSMARKTGYRSVPMRGKNPIEAYTGEVFESPALTFWSDLDEREANALAAMLRENDIDSVVTIDPHPLKFGEHHFSVYLRGVDPNDTYTRLALEGVSNRFTMALSEKRIMRLKDVPGMRYGAGKVYTGSGRRKKGILHKMVEEQERERRGKNPSPSRMCVLQKLWNLGGRFSKRDVMRVASECGEADAMLSSWPDMLKAEGLIASDPPDSLTMFIFKDAGVRYLGKRATNPAKLLTKVDLKHLPPIGSQESKGDDAIAWVKLFTPWTSWTWYMTEFDPATGEAFGLVQGQEVEVGYFSIPELQEIRGPGGLRIERDLYFKPTTISQLRRGGNPVIITEEGDGSRHAVAYNRKESMRSLTKELNKPDVIRAEYSTTYDLAQDVNGRWIILVNGFQWGAPYDRSGAGSAEFGTKQEALDKVSDLMRGYHHGDERGGNPVTTYSVRHHPERKGWTICISPAPDWAPTGCIGWYKRKADAISRADELMRGGNPTVIIPGRPTIAVPSSKRVWVGHRIPGVPIEVARAGAGVTIHDTKKRRGNPAPSFVVINAKTGEVMYSKAASGTGQGALTNAMEAAQRLADQTGNLYYVFLNMMSSVKKGSRLSIPMVKMQGISATVGPRIVKGGNGRAKNPQGVPANIENDPKFQRELAAYRRRHKSDPVHVTAISVPKGYPKYMSVYGEIPEAKYDAPMHSVKGKRVHHFGKRGKNRPYLASSTEKGPKFLAIVGGTFKAKTDWLHD